MTASPTTDSEMATPRAGGCAVGVEAFYLDPDVTAAQVATCARARAWPVLAVLRPRAPPAVTLDAIGPAGL
jgi:hypothetical protein